MPNTREPDWARLIEAADRSEITQLLHRYAMAIDTPDWSLLPTTEEDVGRRRSLGPSAPLERLLDRVQIARERDPETGVISHANLFLLIDRDGRIAYRFGLGERQQRWLTSALRILLREETTSG